MKGFRTFLLFAPTGKCAWAVWSSLFASSIYGCDPYRNNVGRCPTSVMNTQESEPRTRDCCHWVSLYRNTGGRIKKLFKWNNRFVGARCVYVFFPVWSCVIYWLWCHYIFVFLSAFFCFYIFIPVLYFILKSLCLFFYFIVFFLFLQVF